MKKEKKCYSADFETNVNEEDCRVWAYSICEVDDPEKFYYGNSIESFFEFLKSHTNAKYFFHNLKFDGEYIFHYLLNNGYRCVKEKSETEDKTFTTIISDVGAFYSITIYFQAYDKNKHKSVSKVEIFDSMKLIPMSVDDIGKKFKLPIKKLTLDYNTFRPIGHVLTKEEIDYIKNDVQVVAMALKYLFSLGLTSMTIGACAIKDYRSRVKSFKHLYPEIPLEIYEDLRASYKGGFTYLSPKYKEKTIGKGLVLDVNSLYPSVMKEALLPYGMPQFYEGKYEYDFMYPLFIQVLTCSFKLKPGMLPTIQLKHSYLFADNEYIESSKGEYITLTLSNPDLELFLSHYDIEGTITYNCGYKFRGEVGLFDSYIDYWTDQKIKGKKEGIAGLYQCSKLMLNSLYGKFARGMVVNSKYPVLTEDNKVAYEDYPEEIGKGLYIPMGAFITAYARKKTIETSQKIRDYTLNFYNEDYYVYSDTDSIHMKYLDERELRSIVDIDDYKLGYWKIESMFSRGKYLRQKCYIEEDLFTGEMNVTVAGLPKKLGKYVNFSNFKFGFTIPVSDKTKDHKLTYKHVVGGVMLTETDFTIK